MDLNKDMINLDKAMEALSAASVSGEFKGEDLDQLTAASNAVKALRVRVYGSDTKSATKSEDTPAEQVVEKSIGDTEALTTVITQLQEVAKSVTEQASAVTAQVTEIEKMKAEVVKAVEGMTSIIAKIPIRNAQTPEAEGTDRVEKTLTEASAERAGGQDNFKKMHPGAKLRLMFDTKMNGLNK